ncbi:crossover junction endodeoxyribonuclease RuvC [Gottschalkia acidurici 9a]|uniref:Crossover junction endodeoxyribonuclease RuvC n=1 Tax=Gottschalkia acidurici (strain ATCC 7906 / DSM 604 / BCRC 14475 / CIP 104303 / KCTC 5404 / NCIMB 10678 / 9a) TaxID=1128398 RepID=K0AXY8_GOTA9|nr:crossover junction endodeoxyribonuclease RuvC [Gottschalkia acidurici]AFS78069.1 crossover junction endodeoxyribonuclease RuvC [Gottschalkia acidurici 9a]
MIIFGIDPGIAIVGYGVVEYKGNKFKVIDYGAITTEPKNTFPERLKMVYDELTFLLDKYNPDSVAIEELFFNKNAKTAISVGQARGVQLLAAINKGLPIYEYTPLQVKQGVVGYGRAEKRQVQEMVKLILGLSKVPKPDDVADALAVAICHAHSGNFKNMFKVR